jgi:hypothetical protein
MKRNFFILCILTLLFSCTNNGGKAGSENSATNRFRQEVIDLSTNYINSKYKEPKKKIAPDGIITISDNQTSYIIDPARISTGLIDDDNTDDAIISIDNYHGQYLVLTEHLILINKDGKLMLNRVIESDMKILGIKDRVITAEVYTRSRNGPLAGCSLCKEVVKYQFIQGDLVKMK